MGDEKRDAINTGLTRRKMLASVGVTGLAAMSPFVAIAAKGKPQANDGRINVVLYPNVATMKQDHKLREGDIIHTQGFYELGDDGEATYLVMSASVVDANEFEYQSLANGLVAALINVKTVNYKVFGAVGDGVNDDGIQIKAAHAYANKLNIPIVNLNGHFWIGNTNGIIIQTDVLWGKTVFHVNEKYNTRTPRFQITSKHKPMPIELTAEEKELFLSELKPGVGVISLLAQYTNCLVHVADSKDRIGYRAGDAYGGKVSRMREELFYVEEHGRVIGDIAWGFNDFTSLTAYPADENYLTIEGGAFYVTGDYSGDRKVTYVSNGFHITRSRTIIRNQWVGLEKGELDTAMVARTGFYSFATVYDCQLENVRLIPWEKDRDSKETTVGQGTYGVSGNRMFNVVFRNITAEGGRVHWGVFGTNMNKNLRIEGCKLNRIDVHFHCWNLSISDSEVGFRGVSITGGGELIITNTTCRSNSFINFRYDYGAKWDGNIYIKNCRLLPGRSANFAILSFMSANFDYRYPIGLAHMITVEDFVVDYSDLPTKANTCLILRTPSYYPPSDRSLFFPVLSTFKNITVAGGGPGVRMLDISHAGAFQLDNQGTYNDVEFVPNARLLFENIDLEKPELPKEEREPHVRFGVPTNVPDTPDTHMLLPQITFRNCHHFRGDFGGNRMNLSFEDCTINELLASRQGELPGSLQFANCKFKPVSWGSLEPFAIAATLGTLFTNCLLLAPIIDGENRPDLMDRIGFVKFNKMVKYSHLNTRLGKDVLKYYQSKNIAPDPAFINMLKNHHELEAENVKDA